VQVSANTLGGSNRFPGLIAEDNLIMTAPGTYGLELGDAFPTTDSAIGRVSGNILLGGTASPTGLPGAVQAGGPNLFVAPEAGNFTPAAGVPAGAGVHATVLADLNRKASNAGIAVAPGGWQTDNLKLTQTLLDSMPGLEDGIANNESVFTAPGSYANSVREPGRMSFFYSLDSVWKSANNVADGNLVNGLYEIITPEEYSAWRAAIASSYGGYTGIRWADSVIGQNKIFDAGGLFVVSIAGPSEYTRTLAAGNTVTVGGDMLVDFDGYTPTAGDTFDLVQAGSIALSGTNPFGQVLFADGLPNDWGYSLSVVDGNTLRMTITAVPEPATYTTALAGVACGGSTIFRRRKRA
jgi:hypothetical protein